MPIFMGAPIKHRIVACEPLLSEIDLSPWLGLGLEQLVAGGESGENARVCDYRWVLSLREQAKLANVPFWFKQTGANFLKDGKIYRIPRAQQHAQARRAGISNAGLR